MPYCVQRNFLLRLFYDVGFVRCLLGFCMLGCCMMGMICLRYTMLNIISYMMGVLCCMQRVARCRLRFCMLINGLYISSMSCLVSHASCCALYLAAGVLCCMQSAACLNSFPFPW